MENSILNLNIQSAYEAGEKGMKGTVVGSFVINTVLAGSLSLVLGMINSLQMTVHMPMINIV